MESTKKYLCAKVCTLTIKSISRDGGEVLYFSKYCIFFSLRAFHTKNACRKYFPHAFFFRDDKWGAISE